MDFSAILNYTKKAAKSLTVGVVGAVTSDKTTGVVPAIAPIPIEAVDTVSYTHLTLPTILRV